MHLKYYKYSDMNITEYLYITITFSMWLWLFTDIVKQIPGLEDFKHYFLGFQGPPQWDHTYQTISLGFLKKTQITDRRYLEYNLQRI